MATNATQIPSEAIQADRLAWLRQVQRGEHGDPALLLTGLCSSDSERWKIGIADARPNASSQIVLKLPKPASHPEGEAPSTAYLFNQEAVWLIQVHVLYGGKLFVMGSQRNTHYYPALQIPGHHTPIPVDRLIGGVSAYQDARLADPHDYHNHMRENIKPTHQAAVAAQHGPENERIGGRGGKRGKVVRQDAIEASLKLWHESLLFPSRDQYREALLHVYAVLDQRHPLPLREL